MPMHKRDTRCIPATFSLTRRTMIQPHPPPKPRPLTLDADRLLPQNPSRRPQLDLRFGLGNVVGRDYRMLKIFDLAGSVADTRTTLLMSGESGTGKSLLARAIHHRSPRRDKPFVEIACGSLPE